jgi:hypothetical protein
VRTPGRTVEHGAAVGQSYVECSPGGARGPVASSCVKAGVTSYPTWIFADGSRVTAVMSLRELADRVGYRYVSENKVEGPP